MEKRQASDFSRAVGAALRGRYRKAGLSQENVADQTGIKYGTLRRMIAGEAEINVYDLALIAKVAGVTPTDVVEEAVRDIGGIEALSVPTDTTDEVATKRKQREAVTMPGGAFEDQVQKAATRDDELDSPEPDAP